MAKTQNKLDAEEVLIRRMTLGTFLQVSREKTGLSQRAVSKQLGYSTPQFISNWERGLSSPPLDVFPQLAKIYNLTAADILHAANSYYQAIATLRSDALRRELRRIKA